MSKRFWGITLSFLIILSFCFTGCGQKKEQPVNDAEQTGLTEEEQILSEDVEIAKGYIIMTEDEFKEKFNLQSAIFNEEYAIDDFEAIDKKTLKTNIGENNVSISITKKKKNKISAIHISCKDKYELINVSNFVAMVCDNVGVVRNAEILKDGAIEMFSAFRYDVDDNLYEYSEITVTGKECTYTFNYDEDLGYCFSLIPSIPETKELGDIEISYKNGETVSYNIQDEKLEDNADEDDNNVYDNDIDDNNDIQIKDDKMITTPEILRDKFNDRAGAYYNMDNFEEIGLKDGSTVLKSVIKENSNSHINLYPISNDTYTEFEALQVSCLYRSEKGDISDFVLISCVISEICDDINGDELNKLSDSFLDNALAAIYNGKDSYIKGKNCTYSIEYDKDSSRLIFSLIPQKVGYGFEFGSVIETE